MVKANAKYGEPLNNSDRLILHCLAQGMTYAETAQATFYSIHTVEWRLKNIYIKLAAKNKTHAVAIAIRKGLLEV